MAQFYVYRSKGTQTYDVFSIPQVDVDRVPIATIHGPTIHYAITTLIQRILHMSVLDVHIVEYSSAHVRIDLPQADEPSTDVVEDTNDSNTSVSTVRVGRRKK